MATAFVLITVEIGSEATVLEELQSIPEVNEAKMIYGEYDIITRLESSTVEEIQEAIIDGIRRLEGVKTTTTLIMAQ
jgi:DNA-binding Lrp family transcriptional regulator